MFKIEGSFIMCKVKSGIMIENQQDVQNLVIGILFRQEKKYSQEQIYAIVQHYLQGSLYVINQKTVLKIISDNIDMLHRNSYVSCVNGYYTPEIHFIDSLD